MVQPITTVVLPNARPTPAQGRWDHNTGLCRVWHTGPRTCVSATFVSFQCISTFDFYSLSPDGMFEILVYFLNNTNWRMIIQPEIKRHLFMHKKRNFNTPNHKSAVVRDHNHKPEQLIGWARKSCLPSSPSNQKMKMLSEGRFHFYWPADLEEER